MVSAKLSTARLIGSAVLLSASLLPAAASAQSQNDTSVADAARRAREQKKNAAKPARTLTNDDLPAAPAAGQPAAASTTEAAAPIEQAQPEGENAPSKTATTADTAAQADTTAKKHAETEAALKRAKAALTQAQGELDVLNRKAALDSDAYYSKTDYARDTEGKANLDADTQQVNDKKSQVDDLKAKVAALQAELGESAEAEKPAQPR